MANNLSGFTGGDLLKGLSSSVGDSVKENPMGTISLAAGLGELGASLLPEGSQGAGALSGAGKGASMGMALGPYGAAGGALIGGAIGLFNAKKAQAEEQDRRLTESKISESGYQLNKFNYMPNLDV